jgi:hypothetical protein
MSHICLHGMGINLNSKSKALCLMKCDISVQKMYVANCNSWVPEFCYVNVSGKHELQKNGCCGKLSSFRLLAQNCWPIPRPSLYRPNFKSSIYVSYWSLILRLHTISDRWIIEYWAVGGMRSWQGTPKYSDKTCPSDTLSTTDPIWADMGSILGLHGWNCSVFHNQQWFTWRQSVSFSK